jgi:opacity protein-like surface antigen
LSSRVRCCNVLLVAILSIFVVVAGASAQEEAVQAIDYARPGPYVGVGGTGAFPDGWDSDFDNDLNEKASERANQAAESDLSAQLPIGANRPDIIPLEIRVDGADLEDAFLGVNGLVGYRVADSVAFELEGEWLSGSNKSSLDVTGSTGSHRTEVEDLWTLTANVKVFPFKGRFQPFGVGGVGLHHSRLKTDVVTVGVMTTEKPDNVGDPPVYSVDGDFEIHKNSTKLDGAVRVGGGIDIYATENIVAEFTATYVLPFAQVSDMTTDYLSVVWRVIYRF